MSEPKSLIAKLSPCCNIQAVVEESNECVYFYLFENEGTPDANMRACWVRNYAKAPLELDVESMRGGSQPMMPREFCANPEGSPRLDPAKLEIVWFEEGDGAALLYGGDMLCVIPSGAGDFEKPGYAKDCIKVNELAVPLSSADESALARRVKKAQEFWNSWNVNIWPDIQKGMAEAIEAELGKHTAYYSIDGGYWPPKGMVTMVKGDVTYIMTMGVSIVPQPKVECDTENPEEHRRFELGFAIKTELLEKSHTEILKFVSALAALPWANITWLGSGHTIPFNELWPYGMDFPYVMLLKAPMGAPEIDFPEAGGDKVNVLWLVPVTKEEKEAATENGSKELLDRAFGRKNIWIFDNTPKFNENPNFFQKFWKQ